MNEQQSPYIPSEEEIKSAESNLDHITETDSQRRDSNYRKVMPRQIEEISIIIPNIDRAISEMDSLKEMVGGFMVEESTPIFGDGIDISDRKITGELYTKIKKIDTDLREMRIIFEEAYRKLPEALKKKED